MKALSIASAALAAVAAATPASAAQVIHLAGTFSSYVGTMPRLGVPSFDITFVLRDGGRLFSWGSQFFSETSGTIAGIEIIPGGGNGFYANTSSGLEFFAHAGNDFAPSSVVASITFQDQTYKENTIPESTYYTLTSLKSAVVQIREQGTDRFGTYSGVTFTTAEADGTALAFVPEPATWATMLAGFGIVGAALRRRRTARA